MFINLFLLRLKEKKIEERQSSPLAEKCEGYLKKKGKSDVPHFFLFEEHLVLPPKKLFPPWRS